MKTSKKKALMNTQNTQYITDDQGKRVAVILPTQAYLKLLEELEEPEDIRLYDEAKKEDEGEWILLTDYLKKPKVANG